MVVFLTKTGYGVVLYSGIRSKDYFNKNGPLRNFSGGSRVQSSIDIIRVSFLFFFIHLRIPGTQ